ncbi:MAG: hypothetical protein JKY42_02145 [Flavobacteriales bacterium]|nr:hypothetical protein [Flavobacteriales bacterium]
MIPQLEIAKKINSTTKLSLGQHYFNSIGQIIQDLTQADYTFITKLNGDNAAIASPIVSIKHDAFIENIEYELAGTPCMEATKTSVIYYSDNVQQLFPDDEYLKKIDINGYLGASISTDKEAFPFAIITCLYKKEPANFEELVSLIKYIASALEDRIEREYLIREKYELKISNEERIKKLSRTETQLKEIHHRVKNSLQIVASLLSLQKTTDPKALELIDISIDRIHSIAFVHELLYNSEDYSSADIKEYIEKIPLILLEKKIAKAWYYLWM